MRPSRFASCLVVTTLLGCAHDPHGATSASPESVSGSWQALTSTHFVFYTDQSSYMARQVIEELEHDVSVLQALAFPGVTLPPQPIDVVMLDGEQLRALTGEKQLGGQFRASLDVTDHPHLLLMELPNGGVLAGLDQLRRTVLHEMTHDFVRHSVPHVPAWLNEGIASYWETLEIDGDAPEAIVGRPPALDVLVVDWTPLAELAEGDARSFYGRSNRRPAYAEAWGVVHFLYEESPDTLVQYEGLLRKGASAKDAWRDAFGVPPAAFNRRLHELYGADRPLARRVPRPPLGAVDPRAVRTLTPAEVHLLFARAAVGEGSAAGARVQAEIDAAEKLAPDDIDVLRWRARILAQQQRLPDAGAVLERALQLHPDDPRLLALLAELERAQLAARPEAERDYSPLDALFARVAKATTSATALTEAAAYELGRRGAEPARALAEAAVAHNGECAECLDTLARVRDALHDDAGAAEAEGRAVAAWPFESAPTKMLERLTAFRAAARAPARP